MIAELHFPSKHGELAFKTFSLIITVENGDSPNEV